MATVCDPIPYGYTEPGRRTDGPPTFVTSVTQRSLFRRLGPVETLWTYRAKEQRRFLVLPDGRADLMLRFRIKNDRLTRSAIPIVVGPSSVAHVVPVEPGDAFIGARLRPGRLAWFGANSLRDRRHAGPAAMARVPQLCAMANVTRSVPALLDAFAALLQALPIDPGDPSVDAALDLLHLSGGRLDPGELAREVGIGPRRLHRRFIAHVGLAPSTYRSVLRFQRALRLRRRGLPVAAVAHEAGYADQPHMTRAFRKHGEFTPARMADAELGWMPIGA